MLKTDVQEKLEKAFKEHYNPTLLRLIRLSGYSGVEYQAKGCWVYTLDGRKFLDLAGGYGVFSLGHSHPKVIAAVKDQLERLSLSAKVFLSQPLLELCEKLAEIAPGDLKYCFLVNSGAEAVEAALKLVRAASGKIEIIYALNSFHGKTFGALSASGREIYKDPVKPLLPGFKQVNYGEMESLIAALSPQTAAIIIEPIQGEGGIIVPPDDYFYQLRKLCDEKGIFLIADEIQTGLGRTGKLFAVEHWGVSPDIMTLGKALGGGVMPVGAVLGTEKVWQPLIKDPFFHTTTFGGNPLACTAAIAALKVIEEENLCLKAEISGNFLAKELKNLAEKYPELIKEVRGKGLMLGVELTQAKFSGALILEMAKKGLIGVFTLNQPKVIRFEPPLNISEEELKEGVLLFSQALEKVKELFNVGGKP